jgi:EAL and modified HD-GYP domain-containing signal transduction protein
MDVFVARQPIYDRRAALAGYELLYRTNDRENWAAGADARRMSSDVIIHSVLSAGLEWVTGGETAFMKFTSDMLATDLFELLDPSSVVIELIAGTADDFSVRACERMARAGYRLALDGFAFSERGEALLPYASIVKVDVLAHAPEQLAALVERLRPHGKTLLAMKVETPEMHERCAALGFALFQGYYFGHPEILTQKNIPVDRVGIIRLMNLLRDPETPDAALDDALRVCPSLAYQLLRMVGSALHRGCGVRTIGEALRLLGRERLHRWLSLLFASSLVSHTDMDGTRALTVIARARLCERLALENGHAAESEALFLTGLLSGLDRLLQMPLPRALRRIEVADPVREAVLAHEGPFGGSLALALAHEGGEWDRIPALAGAVGVAPGRVTDLYLDSLDWARERLLELRG